MIKFFKDGGDDVFECGVVDDESCLGVGGATEGDVERIIMSMTMWVATFAEDVLVVF